MSFHTLGTAILFTLLSVSAWAEIYETTDEHGNKVFTDAPSGEAQVVDLPEANIADSVEPAPRPAPSQTPSPGRAAGASGGSEQQTDDDGVYIINDGHNDRLEDEVARERRQEVLEGDRPQEVIDAAPPRDVHEADQIKHQAPTPHRAPHVHRR